MKRLLLLVAFLFLAVAARAQDAAAPPSGAAVPSTAPAAGTVASSGAPTIANPAPGPAQPVAFSHKKHVGEAKLGCNDCHEPSKNGSTVAMPQPTKCMLCHAAIATDKPDIQKIAAAAKNNELLHWVRIYSVPSFVNFSHKTHIAAGAQCQDCHGPVAEREVMTLEKDITMGGCISCHTQKNAPTGCDTCHQINSKLQQPAANTDEKLVALLTRTTGGAAASFRRFLAPMAMPRTIAAGLVSR